MFSGIVDLCYVNYFLDKVMTRYVQRHDALAASMESLIPTDLPVLFKNEFTGEYDVSMEGLSDALAAFKKWLAELGQKIKKLFTTDTVKAAATRMAATNVEKKAESRANEGNKNIIRVQFKTIIRANYEKITLSKYSQYIRASQNEILTLMKSLANNHNTVFHALRSKSSDVSLPDIRTDALNKYMDISSNGSTISVNMAASEVTLSVAPSEIKLFSNLVWVTEVNNNNLNTLLKRVASENQAIIAMDGVDPALVKLAGTLQVQLIKLANICKLVFLTEINRAITEVGKAT